MHSYLTPPTISFIAISILGMIAMMPITSAIRHYFFIRRKFILMEIPMSYFSDEKEKLMDLFRILPTPFVFEMAVHQLGKEIHCYIGVTERMTKKLQDLTGSKKANEFHVYKSGGSHLGFYLEGYLDKFNPAEVDFSKMSEIGEGALLQFLVTGGGSAKKSSNMRVLISAPTPYQAQEITDTLNPSLEPLKALSVGKNMREFIHRLTFREFDEREAVVWRRP
jgi:hypothetical protein